MSNTIEINSNMKKFDIVDLDGKVLTTIYFNPTDINILHRYEETMRSLATIKLKLNKIAARWPAKAWCGSVKNFVSKVINGSFLARIKI